MNNLTANQRNAIRNNPQQRQQLLNQYRLQNGQRRPAWNVASGRGRPPQRSNFGSNNSSRRPINFVDNQQVRSVISRPISQTGAIQARGNTSATVERTAFIESFTSGGSNTFTVEQFVLRPTEIPWLRTMSKCFGRFKFRSFQYRYVSQTTMTTSGSIAMGIDPNPMSNGRAKSIQDMQSFQNIYIGAANLTQTDWTPFPRHLSDRWFRIDNAGDQATYPGAIVCASNKVNVDAGITLGYLEIHFVIDFRDPELNMFAPDAVNPTTPVEGEPPKEKHKPVSYKTELHQSLSEIINTSSDQEEEEFSSSSQPKDKNIPR